jgi:cellulose biosynthesis protein BcsQ
MSCALRKRSMKKKGNHFQQTPEYDTEFEFPTNMIDDSLLSEAFQKIEKIMTESNEIMRKQGKSRRALVPVINIAHTVIDRDENKFREVLTQLKSPYQTALRIKTDKQIKNGIQRREQMKKAERQRKFAEFVENLKKKGLKEYQ